MLESYLFILLLTVELRQKAIEFLIYQIDIAHFYRIVLIFELLR